MSRAIPKSLAELPVDTPRFVGREVGRIEDPGLVAGNVEFIDNLALPGMLHCAILRSPHPHARIVRTDVRAAAALPGVAAVITGEDAKRWSNPPFTAPAGWGAYCLAVDKVRFVGEPVAAVAAESRYLAEDALELIEVEYELLPPVTDPFAAMAPDSPLLFEEHGTNTMMDRHFRWGEVGRVFAEADHVFTEKFRWNRVGANPTETFGCISQWDTVQNVLTCRGAYQTPNLIAMGRAGTLKLPLNKIRILSHPHGGAFGGKGGPRGTDISSLLSRKAGGRPVKYIEDRMEYLLAGNSQAWDRFYEASLAVMADGTVTGFRLALVDDLGGSGEGYGSISAAKPLTSFTGCYRIGAAEYDLKLVATNKTPAAPYRGMGPPPHNLVLESMMDVAARHLGLDVAEIRRRNYIRPEQFPYTIPSGNEYDSGQYEKVLDAVLGLADYDALREEQRRAREAGRLVGIGVVSTVEPGVFDWNAYAIVGMPGIGIPEGVSIAFDIMGNVTVRVGFTPEGQGQYTLAAQLIADYFVIDMAQVQVEYAHTGIAQHHYGPGGSRLGVSLSGAILGACAKLADKFRLVAAVLLRVEAADIDLVNGELVVRHAPERRMPAAQVAATMLSRSDLLPPGMEPSPEASCVWTAAGRTEPDDQGRCKSYLTAANATHVVMVEVDRETGRTDILKYFIADDCGTRLNPATVDGQIQGGVAQGVGAALLEEYVYDDSGQPLVSTFVDYLMPTIHEVPFPKKVAVVTPSPFTPLGAKGCGEGAIHTTPAAIICAINDALAPLGVQCRETPASPRRLWKLIQQRK